MGKLSFSKTFNGFQNTIPLSLMPGTYISVITLKGKILYTGKILKSSVTITLLLNSLKAYLTFFNKLVFLLLRI
jgi:hypothetical protein